MLGLVAIGRGENRHSAKGLENRGTAKGARIEAPRWWGVNWRGVWERAVSPSPEKFLIFECKIDLLW